MEENKKLTKGLSGIAGEYFVAAELSRRGFMATITLRNNDSIDILASNTISNKLFAIQVKTNQFGGKSWVLNKKSENTFSENYYYVFVALKGEKDRAEYFIVPSKAVAEYVKNSHSDWLNSTGKNGQKHNDTSMRKFEDKKEKYLEKWELFD